MHEAPLEASQDVISELARLDTDVYPAEADSAVPEDEMRAEVDYGLAAQEMLPRPAGSIVPSLRGYQSIEDLCSSFDIGESSWLSIERTKPSSWHGKPCKGWLSKVHENLTMESMRRKYGGGTYRVRVQAYADSMSGQKVATKATLEVTIAGSPIVREETNSEEPSVPNYDHRGSYPNPQVEQTRLKLEHEEKARAEQRRERLEERVFSTKPAPQTDFTAIEELVEKRSQLLRETMADSSDTLRNVIKEMQSVARDREDLIARMNQEHKKKTDELRETVYTVRTEAATRSSSLETERIRELKERHDEVMRSLKDSVNDRISRLESEHRVAREDLDRRHDSERSRVAEESSRREKSLIEEAARRETAMRDSYESRLSEAHRSSERDLRTLKDLHSGQLLNVQTSGKSEVSMAQTTAGLQVQMLQSQLDRLEGHNHSLNTENEVLRRESIKDPLTAIQEAKALVELTGGGGSVEPEMDWKKGMVQVISAGMSKLPEMANALGAARDRNSRPQPHQPPPQYQQQATGYVPQQPQIAPPQRRRTAFREAPPGMTRASNNPSSADVPMGSGFPSPETAPPMAAHASYDPPMSTGPSEAEWSDTPAPRTAPPPGPPAPQAAPPLGPPPAQQAPQMSPEQMAQMEENFERFRTEVETAIEGGMIPAEMFAERLVEEVGADVLAVLVTQVTPEHFIASIARSSPNSSIVTFGGKRFVNELWLATLNLLQNRLPQGNTQPQTAPQSPAQHQPPAQTQPAQPQPPAPPQPAQPQPQPPAPPQPAQHQPPAPPQTAQPQPPTPDQDHTDQPNEGLSIDNHG